MGYSTITATRKRSIIMAHICSGCGFPLLSVVSIDVEAKKNFTLSLESKNERIADETADNAINEKIREIESCYSTNSVLDGKRKFNLITGSLTCASSYSGHVTFCPICSNLEPWKSKLGLVLKTSPKEMSELNKDNFPIVFLDSNEAEKWAFEKANNIIRDINEKRKDKVTVNCAIDRTIEITKQLKSLTHEIEQISEISERDSLNNERNNTEKLKSQIGFFDFKNKRRIDKKLEDLRQKVEELSKTITKKQKPLTDQIRGLQNELRTIQCVAFGCSNTIVLFKKYNAISYSISSNPIPDEIINCIESTNAIDANNNVDIKNADEDKPAYCRKCGYKLLNDSKFCTKCGTLVD